MIRSKLFSKKRFWIDSIIILSLLTLFDTNLFAQQGPLFPRTGVFHWGGAQPEWYAKFGLVISWNNGDQFAQSIHDINPDCIVLPTRDWNVGSGMSIPDEWIVRDSQGNKVTMYGGKGYMANISDFCPGSAAFGGKKYNEQLPIFMSNLVDLTLYDGVATDGVYPYPRDADRDIDLDRNGVNDWSEHGKSWLISKWTSGVEKVCNDLRNRMGSEKVIHLNSGTFHTFAWNQTNGLTLEHTNVSFTVKWSLSRAMNFNDTAPYPHTLLVDGKGKNKNTFYQMRYFLGVALMWDAYYSYSDNASGEHRYDKYYDEFDLNLGYPKDRVRQIKTGNGGIDEQGIWVKFYDNGMVIINLDHVNNSVTDAEVQGSEYYDGPYYRFQGGQLPDFNNGEMFTEVTLQGYQRNWDPLGFVGDAIILLTKPDTVVADIIIDNVDAGTSPASVAAKLTGNWTNSAENDYAFWGVGARAYANIFNYAKTQPGRGETYAEFIPTIGVPGNYEIFEWHGWLGESPEAIVEATNVPIIIKFAGNQVAEGRIDQSQNAKQWNSLGTYHFTKGTNGSVKITNEANGQVIADAFKFVYKGDDSDDTVPPNPPENLQMSDHTDHTITLTWYPPGPAIDGDSAAAYQVFRNGNLVGRPFETSFTDKGLSEYTEYTYEVYSIDNIGNRSSSSIQDVFMTNRDETPPEIVDARLLTGSKLKVIFSEKVDQASAENPLNYNIDPDITVQNVGMNTTDSTIYYLSTSEHVVGVQYTLSAQDIIDRASTPNSIDPNNTLDYVGITGDSIKITITGDDAYDLYVNGYFIASADGWSTPETYEVPTIGGTNIIAVKGIDKGGEAGILAQIEFGDELFFTNENWKVTTFEETDWEKLNFDDVLWNQATSLGLHGSAEPWASYQNVPGISTTHPVHWIWSSDNVADNIVFLRYKLNYEADNDAPAPPSGVAVDSPPQ
ncbi:MAG: putative glycoside hydrolase [bacterium]